MRCDDVDEAALAQEFFEAGAGRWLVIDDQYVQSVHGSRSTMRYQRQKAAAHFAVAFRPSRPVSPRSAAQVLGLPGQQHREAAEELLQLERDRRNLCVDTHTLHEVEHLSRIGCIGGALVGDIGRGAVRCTITRFTAATATNERHEEPPHPRTVLRAETSGRYGGQFMVGVDINDASTGVRPDVSASPFQMKM